MTDGGYERVTLSRPDWRWWFWVHEDNVRFSAQGYGTFRFARGGRADSERGCKTALARASKDAATELREFGHRPSHLLGPSGRLIPIGDPAPTLQMARDETSRFVGPPPTEAVGSDS